MFLSWKRGSKQGRTSEGKYNDATRELVWSDGEIVDLQASMTQDTSSKTFEPKNLALTLSHVKKKGKESTIAKALFDLADAVVHRGLGPHAHTVSLGGSKTKDIVLHLQVTALELAAATTPVSARRRSSISSSSSSSMSLSSLADGTGGSNGLSGSCSSGNLNALLNAAASIEAQHLFSNFLVTQLDRKLDGVELSIKFDLSSRRLSLRKARSVSGESIAARCSNAQASWVDLPNHSVTITGSTDAAHTRPMTVKLRALSDGKLVTIARSSLDMGLLSANGFVGHPRLRLKPSSQAAGTAFALSTDVFLEFDVSTSWVAASSSSSSSLAAIEPRGRKSEDSSVSEPAINTEYDSEAEEPEYESPSVDVLDTSASDYELAASSIAAQEATKHQVAVVAAASPVLQAHQPSAVPPEVTLAEPAATEPEEEAPASDKANNPFDELLQTERGFLADVELMLEVVRPLRAQAVIPGSCH